MDEKKESDYESDYESDNGENEIMNMMRAMIYLVPLTAVFFALSIGISIYSLINFKTSFSRGSSLKANQQFDPVRPELIFPRLSADKSPAEFWLTLFKEIIANFNRNKMINDLYQRVIVQDHPLADVVIITNNLHV